MSYPTDIDVIQNDITGATRRRSHHAAHHNELATAVMAIENELGTDPAGIFGDVAERLDDMTADIAEGGGGGGGATSGVPTGYLNIKDAAFGAIGNGIVDDTTALQNAINLAQSTGQTVFIPPGTYKMTAEVRVTAVTGGSPPVELVGPSNSAYHQAATLKWSTDLGAGKVAIGGNRVGAASARTQSSMKLQGLYIDGPGGSTPTLGSTTNGGVQMDGVYMMNLGGMRHCAVRFWRAGVYLDCDHVGFYDMYVGNDVYGFYHQNKDVAGGGDYLFIEGVFSTWHSIANYALAGTGNSHMAGVLFQKCHFGRSPFGFYKETAEPGSTALIGIGVTLLESPFENQGNGCVGGPGADTCNMDGWTFINGSVSRIGLDFYTATLGPLEGIFHCNSVDNVEFHTWAGSGGDGNPMFWANHPIGLRMWGVDPIAMRDCQEAGTIAPFNTTATEWFHTEGTANSNNGTRFCYIQCDAISTPTAAHNLAASEMTIVKVTEAVQKGDVLQYVTGNQRLDCQKYNAPAGGTVIAGICQEDAPANKYVLCALPGSRTVAKSTGTITQGHLVKVNADATVSQASGTSDGTVIGWCYITAASGLTWIKLAGDLVAPRASGGGGSGDPLEFQLQGVASARPAAGAVAPGSEYYATDTRERSRTNGSTWDSQGLTLPASGQQDYTLSGVVADRTFDPTVTTLDEMAHVLGTVITDLIAAKVLQ